ncbi:hypothetical protein IRJ41_011241 [Triplophysa rosa]|uniref:C2H2-type domain-containing protein n=1 Tax=Triplophysa rosa TaxID=992332 RepID=A0A9W8C9C0_TRIRA|nr:hypothetical protein IRJ41_011241 [Triplophysa rosa]
MFCCFVCKLAHSKINDLVRHLKLIHAYYPGKKLNLKCAQNNCKHSFMTYAGFRKHLSSVHRNDYLDQIVTENQTDEANEQIEIVSDLNNDVEIPETSSNDKRRGTETQEMCASIIARLQNSGVATSVVTSVVSDMEELVHEIHSNIKREVINLLPADDFATTSKIEHCFDNLDNRFSKLKFNSRLNRVTRTYDQIPVTDKLIYVPLLDTLQFIFRNSEINEHMSNPSKSNGVYKDFCDGSYYKNHPLFSKQPYALQIQLFFDEFESANPLGSKHGIHKIGAIYFILRNFPPKLNSSLMNIHLLSLFHAQDVKNYGFDAILQPLVKDLKVLESSGIQVPFSKEPLFGTVAQVTGDNLGMHTLLGFMESFSAHYFCRFCLVDKKTSQSVFSEDDTNVVLRNKALQEQHYVDLLTDPTISSSFGVKRTCLLNDLKYFHICDNYAPDIMHDILEGVGQYEIKLFLEYLSGIISRQDICNRIYSFNYGYLERKNRPTRLNLDQEGNGIGLNAIQTFCLIRNIPLIFGEIVCEGNKYWHLLLLLLQIINIVFSPVITEGMTYYLKHLIVDHHSLFKELYPQRNLIPKHHYMLHYPRCIRKIGPLVQVWTMRFEAKHKFFKNCVKNFKNITKSLALKHQYAIAYHWESLPFRNVEYGPLKTLEVEDVPYRDIFIEKYPNSDRDITVTSWLRHSGTEYHTDLLVCTKMEKDLPIFSKITDIVLIDDQNILVTKDFETVGFVEHLHVYHVREQNVFGLSRVEDIPFFRPFDLQASYGFDEPHLYIVPVHCFVHEDV